MRCCKRERDKGGGETVSLEEIITNAHGPRPDQSEQNDNQHKAEVEPQHLESLSCCQIKKIQSLSPLCLSSSEHRNRKPCWAPECSGRSSFSPRSFYHMMFEKFKVPPSFYFMSPGSAHPADTFKNHFEKPFWGSKL